MYLAWTFNLETQPLGRHLFFLIPFSNPRLNCVFFARTAEDRGHESCIVTESPTTTLSSMT